MDAADYLTGMVRYYNEARLPTKPGGVPGYRVKTGRAFWWATYTAASAGG